MDASMPEVNPQAHHGGGGGGGRVGEEALIDVRLASQYMERRVKGSISFPARELILRSGELPPRTRPMVVIHDPSDDEALEAAQAFFTRAKWIVTAYIAVPSEADGNGEGTYEVESGTPPTGLRFWEPSPFVAEMVVKHLPKEGGIAYDFGCGSGRDMAFLAGLGWSAVGIDNRAKLLGQAMAMHERYSGLAGPAGGSVHGVQAHLVANSPFRPRSADLVLMVRFLHRPSMAAMLGSIAVGGYFLCSHFVDGVQHSAVGTPKSPDAFLRHGELLEWFGRDDGRFEVLHNEETVIDDGRPVVNLLAKRTA